MGVVPGKQANLPGRQLMATFYQLHLPPWISSEALHGKKDSSRDGWLVSWSLFSHDKFSCQSDEFNCQRDEFNSQIDEFICQRDEFNCKSDEFSIAKTCKPVYSSFQRVTHSYCKQRMFSLKSTFVIVMIMENIQVKGQSCWIYGNCSKLHIGSYEIIDFKHFNHARIVSMWMNLTQKWTTSLCLRASLAIVAVHRSFRQIRWKIWLVGHVRYRDVYIGWAVGDGMVSKVYSTKW